MAKLPDDELKASQREIQRLLGRCLLRLQMYERLIKGIVAHHELSGSVHDLEAIKAARVAGNVKKTLGALVGNLLGSYIVNSEIGRSDDELTSFPEDVNSVGFRSYVELSPADFALIEKELNELVNLRNNLVHHFIDQHDMWSLEGCRGAKDALVAAYDRIDQRIEQLRELYESMLESQRQMAECLQSDEVRELMFIGIAADGTVNWPNAGIVFSLREAAGVLAINGWTSLSAASMRIAEREPEQSPAKYGCSSWEQVVDKAPAFELRYFKIDGQRSAQFREREKPTNSR